MDWREKSAHKVSEWSGSSRGTLLAFGILGAWLVGSFFVGWTQAYIYVDEVITAGSFLLLFVLQRTQSKETLAMQIKLNELLASSRRASSQLINVEQKTEAEIREIHEHFHTMKDWDSGPHSIEEVFRDQETAGSETGLAPDVAEVMNVRRIRADGGQRLHAGRADHQQTATFVDLPLEASFHDQMRQA